jgi:hypothetical protein
MQVASIGGMSCARIGSARFCGLEIFESSWRLLMFSARLCFESVTLTVAMKHRDTLGHGNDFVPAASNPFNPA